MELVVRAQWERTVWSASSPSIRYDAVPLKLIRNIAAVRRVRGREFGANSTVVEVERAGIGPGAKHLGPEIGSFRVEKFFTSAKRVGVT